MCGTDLITLAGEKLYPKRNCPEITLNGKQRLLTLYLN
jgi:hypothetical protein